MNSQTKYIKMGIGVIILIAVFSVVLVYALQTGSNILFYTGIALIMLLSFCLFFFIVQQNSLNHTLAGELNEMNSRMQKNLQKQQKSEQKSETEQKTVFDIDKEIAKILPDENQSFPDIAHYSERILQNIAKELEIVQGLIFTYHEDDQLFHAAGEYAYFSEEPPQSFPFGETLSGQVAKNQQLINLQDVPDGYITILSGLGKGTPHHLIIAPIIYMEESIGVIELASFKPFEKEKEDLIKRLTGLMADKLNELRKTA